MSPVDSGSGAIKGLVEFIVKCESPIGAGGGDVKCPDAYIFNLHFGSMKLALFSGREKYLSGVACRISDVTLAQ